MCAYSGNQISNLSNHQQPLEPLIQRHIQSLCILAETETNLPSFACCSEFASGSFHNFSQYFLALLFSPGNTHFYGQISYLHFAMVGGVDKHYLGIDRNNPIFLWSDDLHPLDINVDLKILGEVAPGVSILNYWPSGDNTADSGPKKRKIAPQLVLRAGNQVKRVTVDVSNNSQFSLSGR